LCFIQFECQIIERIRETIHQSFILLTEVQLYLSIYSNIEFIELCLIIYWTNIWCLVRVTVHVNTFAHHLIFRKLSIRQTRIYNNVKQSIKQRISVCISMIVICRQIFTNCFHRHFDSFEFTMVMMLVDSSYEIDTFNIREQSSAEKNDVSSTKSRIEEIEMFS
jgi:hypothetical protein